MVRDRLFSPAECPERLGEGGSGAHVGPRLENLPEQADIVLEALGAEGSLRGGDALYEERASLLDARRSLLGEQQVRVRAVRRDRERPACQSRTARCPA